MEPTRTLPGRPWSAADLDAATDFDDLTGPALATHLRQLEQLHAEAARRRYSVDNAGEHERQALGVCISWESEVATRLGNAVRLARERVAQERAERHV